MDTNVYEACNSQVTEFRTHQVSPDEILALKMDHLVPIPFKTREDLERDTRADREEGLFTGEVMPRIDLKVLHYFATQLCLQRYPHLINTMDETCMITLGLLVEQWVDEYLTSYNNDEEPENAADSESDQEEEEDDDIPSPGKRAAAKRPKRATDKPEKRVCLGEGPARAVARVDSFISNRNPV